MLNAIRGVLFDLDGTLLDTAPDLLRALNRLREEYSLTPLSLQTVRALTSLGARGLIKHAFQLEDNHDQIIPLRKRFLDLYEESIVHSTQFFPEMENVLTYLDKAQIPWGIVTNKLSKHTSAILKALQLTERPLCVVCGDTLSTNKPDPAPILYACKKLKQAPIDCIYIGDAKTDVLASKASGLRSLVALYGYIPLDEDPINWLADGYVKSPLEIVDWLRKHEQTGST